MRGAAVVVVVTALIAAAPAAAKVRVDLSATPAHPHVGAVVRIRIATDPSLTQRDAVMRLFALARGVPLYRALGSLLDGRSLGRRAFAVKLVRSGSTWRGTVRFPARGAWRLVVPNEGAPGYMIPPPVVRTIRVS